MRAMSSVIGAVLAGGAGSRMGAPKAMVELGGRPLIERPLGAASAAGLDPLVVAKPSSALPELSCAVILEPERPRHPLLGVLTALRQGGGRPVVAIACDMPFVAPSLLAWLAGQSDRLIVCEAGGRLHPLLARYGPELAPELEVGLRRGGSLGELVRDLGARRVDAVALSNFGPPGRLLFNVNDHDDLVAARALLRGMGR
jgi:molybdopterin-guanine dinucleotide biosynthesis protein A